MIKQWDCLKDQSRAVIALSLIVLFSILSVFLYQGVSTIGQLNVVENLSEADRTQFIREYPTDLRRRRTGP
jgi:hypothetical protein